jgi:hypothetical protein
MDKKKRNVGRPPKSNKTKKSAHIFINLTESEKKTLEKNAEKHGCSLSYICVQALRAQNII